MEAITKPTTENLTKTFQNILNQEGVEEVNLLQNDKGNRVLIRAGSVPRVIGRKGVSIRLIKFILENYFGISNPNISVIGVNKE